MLASGCDNNDTIHVTIPVLIHNHVCHAPSKSVQGVEPHPPPKRQLRCGTASFGGFRARPSTLNCLPFVYAQERQSFIPLDCISTN